MSDSDYSLYLLRCADGSFYTGIALDVDARLTQHDGGRNGSRYLRGRGPLTLVFQQQVGDRGEAQRLEYRLRKRSPREKLALVRGEIGLDELLGTR